MTSLRTSAWEANLLLATATPVSGLKPVAGGGVGPPPSEIFRLELISATKVEFATKILDSCQWKLQFQSIVDHSKIMYSCSSMQFGIM